MPKVTSTQRTKCPFTRKWCMKEECELWIEYPMEDGSIDRACAIRWTPLLMMEQSQHLIRMDAATHKAEQHLSDVVQASEVTKKIADHNENKRLNGG